mgnify:CR=1 FL=1
MKIIEVKEIPKRLRKQNTRQAKELLEHFVESGMKKARVFWYDDEYESNYGCYASLRQHATINKLPVKLRMVEGDVYLERK